MHPSAKLARQLADALDAVIFPVNREKKPALRAWQNLTRAQVGEPDILDRFSDRFPCLGVLLGPASNHLCSIDLDSDEWLDRFLAANPDLRGSLISRGARGGNVWVRVRGEYPKLSKVCCKGEAIGEWRATGGFTIIAGIHPSGCEYRREGGPPKELAFHEVHWPPGVRLRGFASAKPNAPLPHSAASLPDCTSPPLPVCTSALLHNTSMGHPPGAAPVSGVPQASRSEGEAGRARLTAAMLLAHQKAESTARERLERESPELARLYVQMLERRFEAHPHERNAVIVQATPFLYRAVAEKFVVPLLEHFYERHAPLFRDPPTQHRQEAEAMLAGVRETYLACLPEDERALYSCLPERQRDAYRICRDLAALPEQPAGPATFFLSADQLALRLGIRSMEAHRLIAKMGSLPVLERVVPGTQRAAGQRGKAATYRWLLPLPEAPSGPLCGAHSPPTTHAGP